MAEKNAVAIINDIVVSEFLFHYIRLKSGVSPFTVKQTGRIRDFILKDEPWDFINQFHVLPTDEETIEVAYHLMRAHNLLPNDALILASCKVNNIGTLATLDEDLRNAAKKENLQLL